jgi:hypothetical protein
VAQDTQTRSSQEKDLDPEVGTFIGSPIWTYDCGPTFPIPDQFSTLSAVEATTFPSVDAAITMHRREIDLQAKAEADQGAPRAEVIGPHQGISSEGDHATEAFTSQRTEILGDNSSNPAAAVLPPTISQLQRLLSIRKANSPTPQLPQESGQPSERSPLYGDFTEVIGPSVE